MSEATPEFEQRLQEAFDATAGEIESRAELDAHLAARTLAGLVVLGLATTAELFAKYPQPGQLIRQLQRDGKLIRITPAGFRESHVHDVAITKEAPNYRTWD